jgi:hypothetical protein
MVLRHDRPMDTLAARSSSPRRSGWPWVVATVAVVAYLASLPWFPPSEVAWPVLNGPAIIGLSAMGALLAMRWPENRTGVLMLASAAW